MGPGRMTGEINPTRCSAKLRGVTYHPLDGSTTLLDHIRHTDGGEARVIHRNVDRTPPVEDRRRKRRVVLGRAYPGPAMNEDHDRCVARARRGKDVKNLIVALAVAYSAGRRFAAYGGAFLCKLFLKLLHAWRPAGLIEYAVELI